MDRVEGEFEPVGDAKLVEDIAQVVFFTASLTYDCTEEVSVASRNSSTPGKVVT